MNAQVELKDPVVSVGTIPGLTIVVWHKQPTVEAARSARVAIDRSVRGGANGRQLTIIAPDAALPSPEAREVMSDAIKSLARLIIVSAVVVQGEGFGAAAARGVLSGLFLVTRPGYPVKVHPDVDSAARWLRQNWKGTDLPPGVADILGAARALGG